jgi:hypothetical protein
MQWLAGKCDVAKIVAELAAKGEQPPIREFGISNCYSALHPVEHASGEWQTDTYGKLGFEALDIWCPFDNCNHLADVVARLGPDGLKQLLAKHQLTVGIPARAPLSVWMESP